ncbi:hypothetical protein LOK49_LG15G01556 [Camellia lanceoleosa]|uniref:Uncharacterized protein n=1 Tax=Camellia lanceoleosa TaxID=1840588 RepID=A0ACC0F304_9ERIC|nr:hypothetical protein LOK49_LG15G01556 [Camellia lanceoleosa]
MTRVSSHRRLGRSFSQKDLSKNHDGYSSQSFALTDDVARDGHSSKNMMRRQFGQFICKEKAEHPSGDDVNSALYEAMWKELRYVVDEIRMELEQAMDRKTSNGLFWNLNKPWIEKPLMDSLSDDLSSKERKRD